MNSNAPGTSSNMNTLVAHPPTTPGPPPHPSSSSAAAALLMHHHHQQIGGGGGGGNIIGLGAVGHHNHNSHGAISQLPMPNYSSYEESEPEATASLSGGQGRIVLNNMARSRAPLPGFSSFI